MNIEEIINKYTNEFGIITDINMLISELEKTYSKEEIMIIIKEIINYNNNKYKEINDFITLNKSIKRHDTPIILDKNIEVVKDKKDSSGIDVDVSKYLDKIIASNTDIEIITILNQIKSENIISVIKCKLLEYITMYKKEIMTNNLSIEELTYYKDEINKLNFQLNTIINYQKIVTTNDVVATNKLIFLSDNGKNLFLEDLEKIDPSEYSAFYSMMCSIIIGTFVGQKSFFVSKGYKIGEIRNINGQRIVYDKITNGYYILISVFDKNNDFTYKQKVIKRMKLYGQLKERIKNAITNNEKDFLKSHIECQEKTLTLLKSKKGRNING